MQHVRECPDFAESGVCKTKGCRLPHVIRANRNRPASASRIEVVASQGTVGTNMTTSNTNRSDTQLGKSAADAQLGDEFISLTFHESESEEEDEEDESEADESEEDEELESETHLDVHDHEEVEY